MAAAKATVRVDNSAESERLQVALQWHTRHAIVLNWCTEELKGKLGFEYPDLDEGIADVSYDTPECLLPGSGLVF
jgi:hypothetical protein